MKVSVIIRTYNRAQILGEAIESILRQTYHHFEIVVVDDGSTDSTSDVVRVYKQSEIKYIRHDRNRGVAAAGNTGILAASGEFISFLDSDDLWCEEILHRFTSFLSRHPGVDIVFSDVAISSRRKFIPSLVSSLSHFPTLLGEKDPLKEYIIDSRQMYLCLLRELPIRMIGWMAKRDIFQKLGAFDERRLSGEDWEFFLRVSRYASFGYIDLALAVRRRRHDSTRRKYWEDDKLLIIRMLLAEMRALRKDVEGLEAVKCGVRQQYLSLLHSYYKIGRRTQSLSICWRMFLKTRSLAILFCSLELYFRKSLNGNKQQRWRTQTRGSRERSKD